MPNQLSSLSNERCYFLKYCPSYFDILLPREYQLKKIDMAQTFSVSDGPSGQSHMPHHNH